MKTITRILLLCAITFLPVLTWACSVCGGAHSKAKAEAYTIITAILASAPVLMFILIGFWIYRKYKQDVN